ncbi:glutaredoxin family protein [Candidatus Kaiserbacteria bacterium]|nr:glutaredoxin family protein [Candidatus Kaiserbacteria bacterium]
MKNVTIYTTPTCHFCHGAKEFFKEHNVTYTEKDVSSDIAARTEMVEKSGQMGVPLIDIEGKLIIGFDESALRKELQIA